MKNVTVTLDDELYRKTRIFAAEADTSVTALVRDFLTSLHGESVSMKASSPVARIEAALEKVRKNHPRFKNGGRLSREELHERA